MFYSLVYKYRILVKKHLCVCVCFQWLVVSKLIVRNNSILFFASFFKSSTSLYINFLDAQLIKKKTCEMKLDKFIYLRTKGEVKAFIPLIGFCKAALLSISLLASVFLCLFLRPCLIHARIAEWGRAFVHGHTFLHSWSGPMTVVVGLLHGATFLSKRLNKNVDLFPPTIWEIGIIWNIFPAPIRKSLKWRHCLRR